MNIEHTHSIGLYLSRGRAAAVWLSDKDQGTVTRVLEFVPTEGESAQTTALEAARKVRQQGGVVEQVYVALDCSYYTQYSLHSEFADARQVESTIKFDAEEAAATDAVNLAVTFTITGPLPTGSEVMVFSSDRQTMTDILLDVQEGGLDPVMMEPDVICLARAMERTLRVSDHPDSLYVLVSENNCYLLQPGKTGYAAKLRSLLLGGPPQRTAALTREILQAMTGWDDEHPLKRVVFVQSPEGVDRQAMAARTGLEIRVESAIEKLHIEPPLEDGVSMGAFLMAVGAGLAPLERGQSADFRRDFMPYQGRRKVMESSLRLIGISLTVLLAAVAIFFQYRVYQTHKSDKAIQTKLAEEYRGAMYGTNPPTTEAINSRLRRTLVNAKRVQEGLGPGDDKSVPAKLTFLLEAINTSPPTVDVMIQQISITDRSMRVKGDTNSRKSTLELFESIKKHPKLKFGSERMAMVGARDTFEFTIEPAAGGAQ
jgi:hypothetical protein